MRQMIPWDRETQSPDRPIPWRRRTTVAPSERNLLSGDRQSGRGGGYARRRNRFRIARPSVQRKANNSELGRRPRLTSVEVVKETRGNGWSTDNRHDMPATGCGIHKKLVGPLSEMLAHERAVLL